MADDSGYIHPTEQVSSSGFPQGGLTKREWFAAELAVLLGERMVEALRK